MLILCVVVVLGAVCVASEVRLLVRPRSRRRPRMTVAGRLLTELSGVAWVIGWLSEGHGGPGAVLTCVFCGTAVAGKAVSAVAQRRLREARAHGLADRAV